MEKNKRNNSKDNELSERKKLESLIDADDDLGSDSNLDKINQHPDNRPMDFYQVKNESDSQAKEKVRSVAEFYLDKRTSKKKYIKDKMEADASNLSNILFQMKTVQHAIIKLLQAIDMGEVNPRNFEVLEKLQGQSMNISKHQAALMQTFEESYRKIKLDNEVNEKEQKDSAFDEIQSAGEQPLLLEAPPENDGIKVRGTRDLMKNMQSILETKKKEAIEDVQFEEVPKEKKIDLTDPNIRPQSDHADRLAQEADKAPENGFEIDDESF